MGFGRSTDRRRGMIDEQQRRLFGGRFDAVDGALLNKQERAKAAKSDNNPTTKGATGQGSKREGQAD